MKLLALDQFSDLGGAQQQLCDLVPAFRELGWQVIFGMPGDGEMFQRVREAGFGAVRIACGPYGAGRKSARDALRFAWQMPRLRRELGRMAEALGVDLIYCNGPRLLAALPAGVPAVFHAHSYLPPGLAGRLAGRALRRSCARVIANCAFVAQPWREYVRTDPVSVIYNGVRGGDALRRRCGWPVVGCVGRIAPEKGQMEFLQAAVRIRVAFPQARFRIIGAGLFAGLEISGYERAVREAAAHLPVAFTGWVDDVQRALAGLDLLLVPCGPHEATTRVIPEAYAAGVPVVAFASGGIPEIVEHGVTGYLAGSVEEMARRATELLHSQWLRGSFARQGRALWRNRFTLERYRAEVVGFLEQAAERGKAGRGTESPRRMQAEPRRPASSHIQIG